MQSNKPSFLVFSVFQVNLDERVNYENHLDAIQYLRESGVSFKPVRGHYTYLTGEKVVELSLVVPMSKELEVKELVKRYKQECYLSVGGDRSAFLHFDNDRVEVLGKWTSVRRPLGTEYTEDAQGNFYEVV